MIDHDFNTLCRKVTVGRGGKDMLCIMPRGHANGVGCKALREGDMIEIDLSNPLFGRGALPNSVHIVTLGHATLYWLNDRVQEGKAYKLVKRAWYADPGIEMIPVPPGLHTAVEHLCRFLRGELVFPSSQRLAEEEEMLRKAFGIERPE